MNKNVEFYIKELRSDTCLVCYNQKKPGYSFCYRCYFNLPEYMRKDLYQRIGDGYEEAFEAACEFLS